MGLAYYYNMVKYRLNGRLIEITKLTALPVNIIKLFNETLVNDHGEKILEYSGTDIPKFYWLKVHDNLRQQIDPSFKNIKKRLNKYKINKKRKFIKRRAKELNASLPKSEVWFQKLYKQYKTKTDKYNEPFADKIPDMINTKFKYIIEIDGSIHDTEKQQLKDDSKDKLYKRLGYQVFRIKAYDEDSFFATLDVIRTIRNLKK